MHLNLGMVLGSAVVGLLVGLTGAGGGALMTPMLIALFGVSPAAAISSDLVASFLMRPVGAAVHLRRGTVSLKMVGWLVLGSAPMAFGGSYLLRITGAGRAGQPLLRLALGAALLAGAVAMLARGMLDRRAGRPRAGTLADLAIRPVPTLVIGAIGGLIVGLTSVGAGSVMIVLLLFAYPAISAGQLVGTDLTQAIPLTGAAALGALIFGQVDAAVTASVTIGSIPAVLAGSLLSARAPEAIIRPAVTLAVFAAGLRYVGVGGGLVAVITGTLLAAGLARAAIRHRTARRARVATPAAEVRAAEIRAAEMRAGEAPADGAGPAPAQAAKTFLRR